ncbi:GIY-YIG nuclease family protein [Labrys sp. KB_33_2]|jgi:predicted GIY-YIG superfamily endonuclease|uniref:GIY-YIG nuclease family protein n=1 Tax=unclassified Labrys (in: a-proteobacteria) TaxID=2688601 RepID=UPI003EBBCE1C
MKREDRKAVVDAYKKRKVAAGIYALRCTETGDCWVGRAPDLSKIRNRLWFTLGQGASLNQGLQSAWSRHGERTFSLEIIEQIEDEEVAFVRERTLKERLDHWVATLAAKPI